MQRIIAVVIGLAAVGIVTAFAAGQLVPSHQAGAAPSAQQVREQNLDGSGFIRVHEQGTGSVNVLSIPTLAGRVTLVAENVMVLSTQTVTLSAAIDTSDCRKLAVLTKHSPLGAGNLIISILVSADGTSINGVIDAGRGSVFADGGYYQVGDSITPRVAGLYLQNDGAANISIDKVWLYCSR